MGGLAGRDGCLSRISGGGETRDYLLTDHFVSVTGGHGRRWRIFSKVQAVGKKVWIAGTAPGVDGIEIEIASRFVSLWKATRDKFRQRIAECIKRQPHSARGRDRRHVASGWEFEAQRHETLG